MASVTYSKIRKLPDFMEPLLLSHPLNLGKNMSESSQINIGKDPFSKGYEYQDIFPIFKFAINACFLLNTPNLLPRKDEVYNCTDLPDRKSAFPNKYR